MQIRFSLRETSAMISRGDVGQRFAVDEFLGEEGWIGAVVQRDHSHDSRMIKLQHHLGFGGKLGPHLRTTFGITGPVFFQGFDGDDGSGFNISSLIDKTEGTAKQA